MASVYPEHPFTSASFPTLIKLLKRSYFLENLTKRECNPLHVYILIRPSKSHPVAINNMDNLSHEIKQSMILHCLKKPFVHAIHPPLGITPTCGVGNKKPPNPRGWPLGYVATLSDTALQTDVDSLSHKNTH